MPFSFLPHPLFCELCPRFARYGLDRQILNKLGVPWHLGKAPKIYILTWRPPPIGWIKVDTDGLAKGNLGSAVS